MKGYPEQNFPLFLAMEDALKRVGFEVWNPARNGIGNDPETGEPYPLDVYLAVDIPAMLTCDAVALLPGWENSEGVNRELDAAWKHGIKNYDAFELLIEGE